MQEDEIKEQLLESCHCFAEKGFLHTPGDSLSLRVPGRRKMLLISKCNDWRRAEIGDIQAAYFSSTSALAMLHACIYEEREDVGAIAISSPKWVQLLAKLGKPLPSLFDEQVRHLGSSVVLRINSEPISGDEVRKALKQGTNAVLLGGRLLSLGMTRERVLFNAEIFKKSAQAFVLAGTCSNQISLIPSWVRFIANRRLLRDERSALASYRNGHIPEGINAY